MKRILILGAGSTSQEIGEILVLQARLGAELELLGFLDDNPQAVGLPEMNVPVLGGLDKVHDYPEAEFVLGIASYRHPTLRRDLTARLGLGEERYHTVIHGSAQVSPSARLGAGCVLMHGVQVNRGVVLEPLVLLAQASCINHDSHIGRYSVVAPSVTLCGSTRVGQCVYIGAGATASPGVEIGDEALIGIGSVLVGPVEPGCTVFGNPARVIQKGSRERWTP